jgi:MFS family permease
VTALQSALGLTLVQAGVLLSTVQLAGASAGLALGALADGLSPRRSMLLGLVVLALASAAGAFARDYALLLVLRVCEGFGFLMVVLAAPPLLRSLVSAGRMNLVMGLWSSYMPLATALALWWGPMTIQAWGWPAWWALLAAASAAMALWLAHAVPSAAPAAAASAPAAAAHPMAWIERLRHTLAAPGPWLLALAFAMYSGQWLAVIGFLPTLYAQAGFSAGATGALSALAAAANIAGNVGAGRALHAGVAPVRLLTAGYVTMALAAVLAYAGGAAFEGGLPPPARFAAVLLFSGVGGLIPGTLFALSLRAAPNERLVGSTVGWMQQWSAAGQLLGPPLVAWVASRAGGWHLTWAATGGCAALGLVATWAISRSVGQRTQPHRAGAS